LYAARARGVIRRKKGEAEIRKAVKKHRSPGSKTNSGKRLRPPAIQRGGEGAVKE